MGVDANLCKYKISKSIIDRQNYVEWREKYYNILNKNNKKWKDFEINLFYTDDRMLNRIIMDSIKETTGDTYSEEGASLFNLETLKLVIDKLKEIIKNKNYEEYEILTEDFYKNEVNELLALLNKEETDLINDKYIYLYHATY